MSVTTTTQNALVPQSLDAATKLAEMMARGKLVPDHLRGSPSDCLMVIEQATRWGMSPFAVAQATSVIQGKLMFEGKLVAAALHTSGVLATRLDYSYNGEGAARMVTVSATLAGETQPRSLPVKLADVRTNNQMWTKQPDQQLSYAAARIWARRFCPEVMLGVYAPEEMEAQAPAGPIDVTAEPTVDRAREKAEALAARFREVKTAGDYYTLIDEPSTQRAFMWLKANRPELYELVDVARNTASTTMQNVPDAAEVEGQ